MSSVQRTAYSVQCTMSSIQRTVYIQCLPACSLVNPRMHSSQDLTEADTTLACIDKEIRQFVREKERQQRPVNSLHCTPKSDVGKLYKPLTHQRTFSAKKRLIADFNRAHRDNLAVNGNAATRLNFQPSAQVSSTSSTSSTPATSDFVVDRLRCENTFAVPLPTETSSTTDVVARNIKKSGVLRESGKKNLIYLKSQTSRASVKLALDKTAKTCLAKINNITKAPLTKITTTSLSNIKKPASNIENNLKFLKKSKKVNLNKPIIRIVPSPISSGKPIDTENAIRTKVSVTRNAFQETIVIDSSSEEDFASKDRITPRAKVIPAIVKDFVETQKSKALTSKICLKKMSSQLKQGVCKVQLSNPITRSPHTPKVKTTKRNIHKSMKNPKVVLPPTKKMKLTQNRRFPNQKIINQLYHNPGILPGILPGVSDPIVYEISDSD